MRCRKCKRAAVINMRQHKLALCETHYVDWIHAQTERHIYEYQMFSRDERVLVAVSGGKDSLALWDVLLDLHYQVDGLYIKLGIGGVAGYSNQSLVKIRQFLASRPAAGRLHVVDLEEEYGANIAEAARLTRRGKAKPCSVCGLVKRHVMNRVAQQGGYDALATGHNLEDEAAVLFGNTIQWQVGYLARQAPVLPASAEGLTRKVKPLCRFYEREMAAYALVRGIDYIYDECPYAVGASSIRYKTVLSEMERSSPGIKLQFYLGFLRARKAGAFDAVAETQPEMHPCRICGQPTTAGDQCAFCRLWETVHARRSSL